MIQDTTTYLWCQTLEESAHALRLDHLLDNCRTANVGAEVGILDPGLDYVEGRSDRDGRHGTSDGRDKVSFVSWVGVSFDIDRRASLGVSGDMILVGIRLAGRCRRKKEGDKDVLWLQVALE